MSKDFFNSRAATWDEVAAEKDTAKLELMARRMDIEPGSTVLDVGVGTGVFIPFLLSRIGENGRIVALDYAEEMLRIARSKCFNHNVSYVCADIEDSRLADNYFDVVVCYSTFPHFRDKFKALLEINRLLKEKGRLYICHTSSRQTINEIHRSLPEVCTHLLPKNEDMRRMLSEAGFEDIIVNDGKDDYLISVRKSG